jgi:hypothetical protein
MDEKEIKVKRLTWVIRAVNRRADQQINPVLGTGARYAIWWVLYYRLGMRQMDIARVWRMTPQAIAYGVQRIDGLLSVPCMVGIMDAADKAAQEAVRRWPLSAKSAQRIDRLNVPEWRGGLAGKEGA